MKKLKIFYAGLLLCFFIFNLPQTFAVVYINEIIPHPVTGEDDWIEFYKNDETSIDISGWKILDSTGTVKTFAEGTLLSSESAYYKVAVSNRLNNSGDNIRLIDKSGNTIDDKSYEADPGINVSIGRFPDGGELWGTLSSSTPNSANSSLAPSLEPKPTQNFVPTNPLTNKPIIKPTSKQITSSSSKSEEKNTILPTETKTYLSPALLNSSLSDGNISSSTKVLSFSDSGNTVATDQSTQSTQVLQNDTSLVKLSFLIFTGTILMGSAVYMSIKKRSEN